MQELILKLFLLMKTRKIAVEKKIEINEHTTRGEIISLFFEEFCEQIYGSTYFRYKAPC